MQCNKYGAHWPTGQVSGKFPLYSLFRSTSGLQWININPLFFSENRGKMGWSARLLAPAWYLSTTPVVQTLA